MLYDIASLDFSLRQETPMTQPWDRKVFSSWAQALDAGALGPIEIETLDQMVRSGEAADRKNAAERLDWQETVIDPDEHMYGF
jgi:hypothetical protein